MIASTPPALGEATTTYGRGRIGPVQVSGPPRPGSRDDGRGRPTPRAADQVVVDAAACGAPYGSLLRPALHLCTEDASPARAQACAGDSGGPVVVRRGGRPELVALVTWGGETQGRGCGEGLPDVAERVAPDAALLATRFAAFAPSAERRTRVRRVGGVLRCVSGPWSPATARLRVSWFREGRRVIREIAPGINGVTRGPDRPLRGVRGERVRARAEPLGCSVRAETAGGWVEERSYNALVRRRR